MKIVDAVWEKRNLGVTCCEITVEPDDVFTQIRRQLEFQPAQYMVVKVPPERPDVMFELGGIGYTFIECMIHLTHDLRRPNIQLDKLQQRLADAVDYALMDDSDINFLFSKIQGGLFQTDRIAIDSHFTKEQAANRYIGWISDELEKGANIYKFLYRDKPIGFFTFKDLGDGIYYPFLVALYDAQESAGLGFNVVYKPICEILKRNGRGLSTYISSNNLNALNVNIAFGCKFQDVHYVYVKHSQ